MQQGMSAVVETIAYIEGHLTEPLGLDAVAAAIGYSKFHLHRLFRELVGVTIHDYMRRRQLTEAARLLVSSEMPILDIALFACYESQQAFSSVFKDFYKKTPKAYREDGMFYPLQSRFHPYQRIDPAREASNPIVRATTEDICDWMDLVRLVVDGFPCLDEVEYVKRLKGEIGQGRALIMKGEEGPLGAMLFQPKTGNIDFFAVHPQYRGRGLERAFLGRIAGEDAPGRDISITTFREGDKADPGYREAVGRLGFVARELLVEFGYPTQRFVLGRAVRADAVRATQSLS